MGNEQLISIVYFEKLHELRMNDNGDCLYLFTCFFRIQVKNTRKGLVGS